MRIFIIAALLTMVCSMGFAYEINCDYQTGEQVCNGMRIKDECKDNGYDVSYILQLGYGYPWLNDSAKVEYEEMVHCIEPAKEPKNDQ